MSARVAAKRTGRPVLRGPKVQYPDGTVVTPPPLDLDSIIADLQRQEESERGAFLSVLAHSLTVDIRGLLLDRPVPDSDLDRIHHINEFLHQLTSCVNPHRRRSAEGDADLLRAIVESASLHGLEPAIGRALASAASTVRPADKPGDTAKLHPSAVLRDVVLLGGLALEAEDCRVRAAMQGRGKHGGLVRNQNQRYYQFVIWLAVLSKWNAVTEQGGWDLTITANGEPYFFELKNWRGRTGGGQLPEMQRDIDELRKVGSGLFIVISDNPTSQTEENLRYLESNLQFLNKFREDYRFGTFNEIGDRHEFWIAGWRVLPMAPP